MANHPSPSLTRRQFIGGSTALACLWPSHLIAQTLPILRVQPGRLSLPSGNVAILGFGGTAPGPILRARKGEELKIRIRNDLDREMNVHWHGIRGLPGLGGPDASQPWIGPGEERGGTIFLRDAGTFLYRGITRNALKGMDRLYGALVVDETQRPSADRDVVLVLDEWRVDGEGQAVDPQSLLYKSSVAKATANSASPFEISTRNNERLRLRLINATARHAFALRFENHPVRVMAIDGQPAEPFLARDNKVLLGPGNRMDLFVDMLLAPGSTAQIVAAHQGRESTIARFTYTAEIPLRSKPLDDPSPLPPNALPERIDLRSAFRAELPLHESGESPADLNSRLMASPGFATAPLFSVKRGRPVALSISNSMTNAVAIHIHGHCVRLLDRMDDGWKPFWLDSLMVEPREIVRVTFVADRPGKWPIECQAIERPERINAWFEIT